MFVFTTISEYLRVADLVLFDTADLVPNSDCRRITPAVEWFMVSALVLNSLVFFFRVRAVYLNSIKATVIFGLLWVTTLTQLLPPIASELHITDGPRNSCSSILNMEPWVVTGFIFTALFDSAVFIAISIQVLGFTSGLYSWKEQVSVFINAKGLGEITRVILQTGQIFYL